MADETKYYVPWFNMEQIDVAASTYLKQSSPSLWQNSRDKPLIITHILVDSNSLTTASLQLGKRGLSRISDDFVASPAMHNIERLSNQTTDCAAPVFKFDPRYPVLVPPRQRFEVELTELTAAARVANVQFYGYRLCDPSEIVLLQSRVSIAASGAVTAIVDTDPQSPIILTDFMLYLEETGTVAKLRGLKIRVSGGGLAPWSTVGVRGTVMFPNRNGGAAILELSPRDLILAPGEVLEFVVKDTSGSAVSLYVGVVGYTEDRRS
jgi:hypothetical protein